MKYSLLVLLAAFALLIASCKEDDPVEPPTPSMAILEAPTFLAASTFWCYTYRVQLTNVYADSVTVAVHAPGGALHSTFALYDDGGTGSGYPHYACSPSGDIVPNDGQYTRRISASLLADSLLGSYQFVFSAPEVSEQVLVINIENVDSCMITSWPQLSQLDSCFAPFDVEVQVTPSEHDSVSRVWLTYVDFYWRMDIPIADFSPVSGDTIWRLTLTADMFSCLRGQYVFAYKARTGFGMVCRQEDSISIHNMVPLLSNLFIPDTIYRPTEPGVAETTYVTLHMSDCELAGDTSFVGLWFDASRDTTPWPPHPDSFFLRDNGRDGDAVAGDQTYTVGLLTTKSDSLFDNVYYFRFYAIDGYIMDEWPSPCPSILDTSNFLFDSVRVIQPPGGLLVGGSQGSVRTEADFGVVH